MAIKISGTTVIDDSRNVTNVGSIGDSNTVYYGDGSGLSGIEAGSSTFTASGAISNGDTVIVNSDGTVSVVAEAVASSPNIGDSSAFHSANTVSVYSAYDPDQDKVIVVYRDDADGSKGKAVVGTVSGTDITFGSEVTFNDTSTGDISVAYDTNTDRALVTYATGGAETGTGRVLSISGNSISVGNASTFNSGSTSNIYSTFDSSNNKVVITFRDHGNSNKGKAVVATITGGSTNTVSFGSEVTWYDDFVNYLGICFDSTNNKVVITGGFTGASGSKGRAIVGTVSGTSISFGTAVVFEDTAPYLAQPTFDSTNGKVVIVYQDRTASEKPVAKVGTVSGTSISFGSKVDVDTRTGSNELSITYDSHNNRVVAIIGNFGKAYVGTVSGTSISFDSGTTFNTDGNGNSSETWAIFDSTTNQVVVTYKNNQNSNYGTANVITITGTNANIGNFIGIAAEAISNAATGTITMVTGINASQSGLTAGQQYFVQKDGSLSTTADTPSLLAGTAISSTQLIVKR